MQEYPSDFDWPQSPRHLCEEEVDSYCLARIEDEHLESVETHLLVCAACRLRVEEEDRFASALRETLPGYQPRPSLNGRALLRMAATVGIVLLCSVGAWRLADRSPAGQPPAAVTLVAHRGPLAPPAPAGRSLDLTLDANSLPSAMRIEIADSNGLVVISQPIRSDGRFVRYRWPQGAAAGQYWVRLFERNEGSAPLREFSLRLVN